jgi:hypothetical protein
MRTQVKLACLREEMTFPAMHEAQKDPFDGAPDNGSVL